MTLAPLPPRTATRAALPALPVPPVHPAPGSPDLRAVPGFLPRVSPPERPSTAQEHEDRSSLTARLLQEAAAATDELERRRTLNEVVQVNIEVAESIASRYRNRGVPDDDLNQVACLALVKAVARFDPAFGRDFLSYAVPTIRGEIKRHFRDHGWAIRLPRRLQELQSSISVAVDRLTHELGRAPLPSELAAFLDEDEDTVIEALSANGCFTPASLDVPLDEDGDNTLAALMCEEDEGRAAVDARVTLAPAVRRLSERDQRILYLRFFAGWTQLEIAQDIGVTQMQVSRLLTRILRDLRRSLESDPEDDPGVPAGAAGA